MARTRKLTEGMCALVAARPYGLCAVVVWTAAAVSVVHADAKDAMVRVQAVARTFAAKLRLVAAWAASGVNRARGAVIRFLIARAVHVGDTLGDLDRRGSTFRVAMWSFGVIALLLWAGLGWKAAMTALFPAVVSGVAATAYGTRLRNSRSKNGAGRPSLGLWKQLR